MANIGFAGTDGRTLLCAYAVSTAKSERYENDHAGVVIRGTPAMPKFSKMMGWPVEFIPTAVNSAESYAQAVIKALWEGRLDYVLPMPEALFFDGLVDRVAEAGFGGRILGLAKEAAFVEGDKIRCKELCREAGIPVAPAWTQADARDYKSVLKAALSYLADFGGAVLKYPYSAGGKGARIILDAWEIKPVYDRLMQDYGKNYRDLCGQQARWPLLIEARMSGAEISFTVLADAKGSFQFLPTAMDYPERFTGPASKDNPITGGTGAISPHPMESPELIALAGRTVIKPMIEALRQKGLWRPCLLYPGCFVSMDQKMKPTGIRVCEFNIRAGEPEAQPVMRRLRNPGALIVAALESRLDQVEPEIRADQISICLALMTGPGGPQGQKGYPWSCTKGERLAIDLGYMKKKGIQVIPSALALSDDGRDFISDGTRVAYLNANCALKPGQSRGEAAEKLRNRLLAAYDNGKIRVIPRENEAGNRLDLRRDIGRHYLLKEELF